MKNKILSTFLKHKFLALFVCLSVLSISSLQAQRTMTGTEAATELSNNGSINEPNGLIINGDVNIINAANTARIFTITATAGEITINGNINLSGEAGTNPSSDQSTVAQRTGKNGHSLNIVADGNVTISGIVNTSGGAAASAPTGYQQNRIGGNGGHAGNVSIISNNNQITINSITANGGNGGQSNMEAGSQPVGAPGRAGNVTIEAEESISTTGAITANAGHVGQNDRSPFSSDAVTGVPASVNGGTIKITSNNDAVNIGGAITANGGNGTGQATNTLVNGRNKASTDGGKGGTVEISSCSNLTITAAITVNGGLPGAPKGSPNGGTIFNQAGKGGEGGNVILLSRYSDVETAQIQANGRDGSDVGTDMQGDNSNSSICRNPVADWGGEGGKGGDVNISAPIGTLIVNGSITANAGRGGSYNNVGSAVGGIGGDGGMIHLTRVNITYGTGLSASNIVAGGGAGGSQPLPPPCAGQNGNNGTVTTTPTFYDPIILEDVELECGDDEITVEMLLGTRNPNDVPAGAIWQIEDAAGSGNFIVLTLPYQTTMADDGKKIRLKIECIFSNEATIEIEPCNLTLIKTASPSTVCEGEEVTYILTLTNYAPTATSSTIEVTDHLLAELTLVEATSDNGAYSAGIWTLANPLAASGGTATLTITAEATTAGSTINYAYISLYNDIPYNSYANAEDAMKDTAKVTINPKPATPTVAVPVLPPVCSGDIVNLLNDAGVVGTQNLVFYESDKTTEVTNYSNVTIDVEKTFYVRSEDPITGCVSDFDSIQVVFKGDLFVDSIPEFKKICEGEILILDTPDYGPKSSLLIHEWRIGNAGDTDYKNDFTPIDLPIALNVNDHNGKIIIYYIEDACANKVSNKLELTVLEVPEISIMEKDGKTKIAPGEEINIELTLIPDDTPFTWEFNGREVNPTFPYQAFEEELKIIAIADNGVCPAVLSNKIIINVYWPNAIISGGKNVQNGTFLKDSDMKMTIFNRYGITIFSGTQGWDGTYEGKLVDPGTYYYYLELPDGSVRKATLTVVKEQ